MEEAWSAGSGSPTIYLFQDAHANLSGQTNLSRALDHLLENEKELRWIFMEGGSGDSSLSFLRAYASADERRTVAERYLKKGLLHGEEYLDLSSDRDMALWGVEDLSLYLQALEAYRLTAKERSRFLTYLALVESAAESLKPAVLNPRLLALDREIRRYRKNKISVTDYAESLLSAARDAGVSADAFRHLRLFSRLRELEAEIDFKAASAEQIRAVSSLSAAARREIAELTESLPAGQAGANRSPFKVAGDDREGRAAFYAVLREKLGSRLSEYPELARYADYLDESKKIQAENILNELSALEKKVLSALSWSGDEVRLLRASEITALYKKLFELTMTPDEYRAYRELSRSFGIERATGFLNKKIVTLGVARERALLLEAGFESVVGNAEQFYDLTLRRDEAMVRSALGQMGKENASKAVLIAGGFHAANLKNLLKSNGVSYVSIRPQILHETNLRRYEETLLNQKLGPAAVPPVAGLSTIRRAVQRLQPEVMTRLLREFPRAPQFDPALTGARQSASAAEEISLLTQVPLYSQVPGNTGISVDYSSASRVFVIRNSAMKTHFYYWDRIPKTVKNVDAFLTRLLTDLKTAALDAAQISSIAKRTLQGARFVLFLNTTNSMAVYRDKLIGSMNLTDTPVENLRGVEAYAQFGMEDMTAVAVPLEFPDKRQLVVSVEMPRSVSLRAGEENFSLYFCVRDLKNLSAALASASLEVRTRMVQRDALIDSAKAAVATMTGLIVKKNGQDLNWIVDKTRNTFKVGGRLTENQYAEFVRGALEEVDRLLDSPRKAIGIYVDATKDLLDEIEQQKISAEHLSDLGRAQAMWFSLLYAIIQPKDSSSALSPADLSRLGVELAENKEIRGASYRVVQTLHALYQDRAGQAQTPFDLAAAYATYEELQADRGARLTPTAIKIVDFRKYHPVSETAIPYREDLDRFEITVNITSDAGSSEDRVVVFDRFNQVPPEFVRPRLDEVVQKFFERDLKGLSVDQIYGEFENFVHEELSLVTFSPGPVAMSPRILAAKIKNLEDSRRSGTPARSRVSYTTPGYKSYIQYVLGEARALLNIPEDFSLQFHPTSATYHMRGIPENFLPENGTAVYAVADGSFFGQAALKAAQAVANKDNRGKKEEEPHTAIKVIPSSIGRLPKADTSEIPAGASYVYIVHNNTDVGTQWKPGTLPDTGGVPLILDLVSDAFMWEITPEDWKKIGMIFFSLQKPGNAPAMTFVAVNRRLLGEPEKPVSGRELAPGDIDYGAWDKSGSTTVTPNTSGMDDFLLTLAEYKRIGGVQELARLADARAKLLYEAIDQSGGFYATIADTEVRSDTNPVFRLRDKSLTAEFLRGARWEGLEEIVGRGNVPDSIRASEYYFPEAHNRRLVRYMREFQEQHGARLAAIESVNRVLRQNPYRIPIGTPSGAAHVYRLQLKIVDRASSLLGTHEWTAAPDDLEGLTEGGNLIIDGVGYVAADATVDEISSAVHGAIAAVLASADLIKWKEWFTSSIDPRTLEAPQLDAKSLGAEGARLAQSAAPAGQSVERARGARLGALLVRAPESAPEISPLRPAAEENPAELRSFLAILVHNYGARLSGQRTVYDQLAYDIQASGGTYRLAHDGKNAVTDSREALAAHYADLSRGETSEASVLAGPERIAVKHLREAAAKAAAISTDAIRGFHLANVYDESVKLSSGRFSADAFTALLKAHFKAALAGPGKIYIGGEDALDSRASLVFGAELAQQQSANAALADRLVQTLGGDEVVSYVLTHSSDGLTKKDIEVLQGYLGSNGLGVVATLSTTEAPFLQGAYYEAGLASTIARGHVRGGLSADNAELLKDIQLGGFLAVMTHLMALPPDQAGDLTAADAIQALRLVHRRQSWFMVKVLTRVTDYLRTIIGARLATEQSA